MLRIWFLIVAIVLFLSFTRFYFVKTMFTNASVLLSFQDRNGNSKSRSITPSRSRSRSPSDHKSRSRSPTHSKTRSRSLSRPPSRNGSKYKSRSRHSYSRSRSRSRSYSGDRRRSYRSHSRGSGSRRSRHVINIIIATLIFTSFYFIYLKMRIILL